MSQSNIGLDKIELGGFIVLYVDFDHLIALSQSQKKKEKISIQKPNRLGEWYGKIADNNMFGDLLIGAKRHGNLLRPYAYVTITPTHVCNDNTNNLPKQVYDAHLKEVVAYIEAKYRIVLAWR